MMEGVELQPAVADALAGTVTLGQRLVQGRRASLMLPTDGGDDLQVVVASGLAPEASHSREHLGDSISGLVAHYRQPLLVNQAVPQTRQRATRYQTGSFISVPIPIADGHVGVLNVADPQGGQFGVGDLAALLSLAERVGPNVALSQQQIRIDHLEAVNRNLRRQVIDALESERQRIARELHDEAGHTITAALLRLDLAMARLPGEATYSRTLVEAVHASLVDYAATLHALAFALRPRILQDLGVGAALRSLSSQAQECGIPQVALQIEGEVGDLGEGLELLVFRVVQEALTNVRKHAQASRVEVILRVASEHVEIIVEDNGVGLGMVVPVDQQKPPSLGLAGIRERVEVFGGSFAIGPGAVGGTRLTVRLSR
jgi:signal transduction histidine kinase